jgi:hypothetical protein
MLKFLKFGGGRTSSFYNLMVSGCKLLKFGGGWGSSCSNLVAAGAKILKNFVTLGVHAPQIKRRSWRKRPKFAGGPDLSVPNSGVVWA